MKKYKFRFTTMQRQWLARCVRRALGNLIKEGWSETAKLVAEETYGIEWDVETVLSEKVIDQIMSGADEFGCDMMAVMNPEEEGSYDPLFVKLMQQDDMEKISKEVWDMLAAPTSRGAKEVTE